MKKTYFAPVTECVKVNINSIMQASNATLTIESADEIKTEEEFGARETFSLWDEDE